MGPKEIQAEIARRKQVASRCQHALYTELIALG
jgi:hypothetical protein